MNKLSLSVVLLAFLAFVGTAQAAWRWEGKLVDGRSQVTASVSENGKHLRIACQAGNDRTTFQIEFSGSGLSDLDRTEGAQESLVLRFDGAERAYNERDGWADVWYAGDKRIWRGALLCTELVLEFLGMDPVATTGILGRSFVTPDQLFQTLLMNGAYRITIADDIQSGPSARIPMNQRQQDIRTARNS